jgi:hypothetical protein
MIFISWFSIDIYSNLTLKTAFDSISTILSYILTLSIPDEGYYRNVSCALNISTFLLARPFMDVT